MARDWEATFTSWGRPPGPTQEEKCANAERGIKKAIGANDALAGRNVTVFTQGSFRNRTSVKTESDVDICVRCDASFIYELPNGYAPSHFGFDTPAAYTYAQFKTDVGSALVGHFGGTHVARGKKAFDVHENTYRVDADVIPAFEYRWYQTDGTYLRGTAFLPDGAPIYTVNWPEQNFANGKAKNEVTNRRFRAGVRILKTLRNEMMEAGVSEAQSVPSYLSECLMWNVPNQGFNLGSYAADVRYALAHLFNNTRTDEGCQEWVEVNELKYLFHAAQPWTRQSTNRFLAEAWKYIGFD